MCVCVHVGVRARVEGGKGGFPSAQSVFRQSFPPLDSPIPGGCRAGEFSFGGLHAPQPSTCQCVVCCPGPATRLVAAGCQIPRLLRWTDVLTLLGLVLDGTSWTMVLEYPGQGTLKALLQAQVPSARYWPLPPRSAGPHRASCSPCRSRSFWNTASKWLRVCSTSPPAGLSTVLCAPTT